MEMTDLERALEGAAKQSFASSSERAARRLVDGAADHGLLDVAFMETDSPVGPIKLAATPRGLVRVSFATSLTLDGFVAELSDAISPRIMESPAYFEGIRRELEEYFAGRRTRFDLPLDWRLTGGFGRKVLRETARIPYGKVSTYKEVARAAGNVRAHRAAGNALGANPIPIVVPCHRVLRSGGALGGYGGGPEIKAFLLGLEGAI
jgi:methylated-DNA-[protein]-cysteine S-methyltransferase